MKKLYVGNLLYSATEEEIRSLFSQYGKLESVLFIKEKGFGFVEYTNKEDAEKSLELDGENFQGRPLKVSQAKKNQRDSSSI